MPATTSTPAAGPLGASVAISGIAELVKAMDALAPELSEMFHAELAGLLDSLIVPDAQRRIRSRRAAATIHAATTSAGATLAAGSAAVPWYGWFDFGSRDPRTGQPRRVGPWANSGLGPVNGRALLPAIEANSDELIAGAERVFDKVVQAVGLI